MSNKLMGAAAIILDSSNRVLLVKHSYGIYNWDLPGGKSETHESAQETVQREVMEETGLQISVQELTGIYYDPDYDMHHFAFNSINEYQQEPHPNSSEILEYGYFSVEDLPKPISDFTVRRIQDSINFSGKNLFHVIGPRQWIK